MRRCFVLSNGPQGVFRQRIAPLSNFPGSPLASLLALKVSRAERSTGSAATCAALFEIQGINLSAGSSLLWSRANEPQLQSTHGCFVVALWAKSLGLELLHNASAQQFESMQVCLRRLLCLWEFLFATMHPLSGTTRRHSPSWVTQGDGLCILCSSRGWGLWSRHSKPTKVDVIMYREQGSCLVRCCLCGDVGPGGSPGFFCAGACSHIISKGIHEAEWWLWDSFISCLF